MLEKRQQAEIDCRAAAHEEVITDDFLSYLKQTEGEVVKYMSQPPYQVPASFIDGALFDVVHSGDFTNMAMNGPPAVLEELRTGKRP